MGTIVVNSEGIAVKTTLDNSQTVQYTALITGITKQARAMVRNIDPGNDLTFLRLRCRLFSNLASEHCLKWLVSRSKKNEILIAPDRDYILIVVQLAADHLLNTAEQA